MLDRIGRSIGRQPGELIVNPATYRRLAREDGRDSALRGFVVFGWPDDAPGAPGASEDETSRLWARVDISRDTGCWEWLAGATDTGYGRFHWGRGGSNSKVYPHRWTYEAFFGPIPEGKSIDHLCGNPSCCNPLHLVPATNRENVLRGSAPPAINARKEVCDQGHPFDEANTIVRPEGGRRCRKCHNEADRRYRQRKKEDA